jgi:hypothetical protein
MLLVFLGQLGVDQWMIENHNMKNRPLSPDSSFHGIVVFDEHPHSPWFPFSIAAVPDSPKVSQLERTIHKKDIHVVGAALDKGLVSEIKKADLDLQAFFPGDFIRAILPHHVDYRSVRKGYNPSE